MILCHLKASALTLGTIEAKEENKQKDQIQVGEKAQKVCVEGFRSIRLHKRIELQ